MLERISISDFVIVDRLELDIRPGLTVLTGETGAGKSILLDALGFVLGDRADVGILRPGAERADVSAIFDIRKVPEANRWIIDHELDAGDECILRRTLGADGRSRASINAQPVPVTLLRELGELLVDIHGQNTHQWLLKPAAQRITLDDYAAHSKLLGSLAEIYEKWNTLKTRIDTLQTSAADRTARLELLRFQVGELVELDLGENETEELDLEHSRLSNAARLLEGAERTLQSLDGDDESAIAPAMDKLASELESLAQVDPALRNAAELFTNASIQLGEAGRELRAYRDGLDLDPERLHTVEERIASIHTLARKHRVDPKTLATHFQQLRRELEEFESGDYNLDALQQELKELESTYRNAATQLSASRVQAAATLSAVVTRSLQTLGMRGGEFKIEVTERPDTFSPHGTDHIEFLVQANPGQPLRPLAKVASGGELSRISLAIEVATAQTTGIPTLVFDEVDAGVGGGVAEIVGRKLRALAKHRQIICVTHLPQVAAQGEQHWTVTKNARGGTTRSSIAVLGDDARIDEIARMLGGVKVTAQTKSHAKEMLHQANA